MYFWSSVFYLLHLIVSCTFFALKRYGFPLFPFSLICFLFFFPSSLLPSLPSFLPFFFFHVWHQSVKIRLGADCGSDHELLIAKFRLELKEVGKITRPFGYNRIPYDHTVGVTNCQGIRSDRVSEELWTEVCDILQEAVIKKKKCKKAKWLSEEALQRAEERKEEKGKGKKKRHTHLNAKF